MTSFDERSSELERALRERLGALLGCAPMVLFMLDAAGKVTFATGQGLAWLGLGPDGMLGLTLAEAYADLPWVAAASQRALADEQVTVTGKARGRWFQIDFIPVRSATGERDGVMGVSVDITGRRLAEEALSESEARMRLLADATFEGIALHENGLVLEANTQLGAMFGYTREELIGLNAVELAAPESRAQLLAYITSSSTGTREIAAQRKDGTRFDAELHLRGEVHQGRATRALAARDITERKRVEQALRQSEHYMRTLLTNAPIVFFLVNREGMVTAMEGRGLEALGPGGPSGRSLFDELGDDLHALDEVRRALRGETFTGVTELPTHGLWFETRWTPVREASGSISGALGVATDITERKRAEEAAQRQTQRLEILAEASRTFAEASLDPPAVLNAMVQAVARSLGDICDVFLISADRQWLEIGAQAARNPESRRHMEIVASAPRLRIGEGFSGKVARDGEPLFFTEIGEEELGAMAKPEWLPLFGDLPPRSLISVPLHGRREILGTLTCVRITPGRSYTPDDFNLFRDLAERAALALENARLYRDVQEAVRARDEFLSVASHELKTPLTSLLLSEQTLDRVLRKQAPGPATELVRNALALADRQGRRLSRLIDDLLDVSRITAGRLALELDDVDLAQLVEEASEPLREAFERAGSTLALELQRGVSGRWDLARLEQVVTNLLTNALKFGEGKPISVRVWREGATAHLCVRDEGIGIPTDQQAQVFERFERAVSAKHYGGLGLGLYIARSIVDAHGGRIQVESAPGQGARFTVALPLRSVEPSPQAPASPPPA